MTQDSVAQFALTKYLNLETFRKSGVGVRTPVWFAQVPGQAIFYVYSEADAGKLKRIRNNPSVRIAPCNFRGDLRGVWVEAHARICEAKEASAGQQLLRRKYGLLKIVGDWLGRMMRHRNAMLAIELA
jgi:PPOX class probable F420-dependent enzyme